MNLEVNDLCLKKINELIKLCKEHKIKKYSRLNKFH